MQEEYFPEFLVERPAEQRFWVVRASGGSFARHFQDAGIMAIGHLNEWELPSGPITLPNIGRVLAALKAKFPDRSRSSLSSHANQVFTFCNEIQIDDLVVTVDSRNLMIGRVTGTVYADYAPVVITDMYGNPESMEHTLRRAVSWGPLLSRKSIPTAMEMTLLAHQTVFNLDRHWTAVYHLLYPCFVFGDVLYLSANIKQKDSLDNYSITQFFGLLSGVESMAKSLEAENEAWVNYPAFYPGELTLTSKAEFMSPGTIWAMVAMGGTAITWATVIYVMLFGGDVKFFKADGILDLKTRQKIWERVLKLKETHDFDRVKNKLQVDIPRLDTSAIEVPDKVKKPRKNKALAKLDKSDGA